MHNPLTRDFSIRLDKLRQFADLVEETFVEKVTDLESRLAKRSDRLPPEERADFFGYHVLDYLELADELPTVLRYSVLTSADTALEVYLNNTCEMFAQVHDLHVRVTDLRGDRGIKRARNYLKKVAEVPFPDTTPKWTEVLRLHELRNAIIHADGVVPVSEKTLRQWSKQIQGIRIHESGEVSLDRDFTEVALVAYQAFGAEFDEACGSLGLWSSVFPPLDVEDH